MVNQGGREERWRIHGASGTLITNLISESRVGSRKQEARSLATTKRDSASGGELIITTSYSYDRGAGCLLKVHIKDGKITRIRTDERRMPSLKACVRGLAQRDVVYAPDRLTKPLKGMGKKGAGDFVPISWNEALGSGSRALRRVKTQWGNNAIFLMDYSGSISPL
jgi:anaerobic dimethyl sulfoxide reductase subunit A